MDDFSLELQKQLNYLEREELNGVRAPRQRPLSERENLGAESEVHPKEQPSSSSVQMPKLAGLQEPVWIFLSNVVLFAAFLFLGYQEKAQLREWPKSSAKLYQEMASFHRLETKVQKMLLHQRDFLGQELVWKMERKNALVELEYDEVSHILDELESKDLSHIPADLIVQLKDAVANWYDFHKELSSYALRGDPDTANGIYYNRAEGFREDLQMAVEQLSLKQKGRVSRTLASAGVSEPWTPDGTGLEYFAAFLLAWMLFSAYLFRRYLLSLSYVAPLPISSTTNVELAQKTLAKAKNSFFGLGQKLDVFAAGIQKQEKEVQDLRVELKQIKELLETIEKQGPSQSDEPESC